MKRIQFLAFAVLLLTGCTDALESSLTASEDENPINDSNIIEIPTTDNVEFTESELIDNDGINQFGISFLNIAAELDDAFESNDGQADHNISVSPLSATLALALAAKTCDDDTEKAISEMFGFSDTSTFSSTVNKLIRYLPYAGNGTILELANAAFYNDQLSPSETWKSFLSNYLYAYVCPLDFGNSSSMDIINNWCYDNTHGTIPDFLKSLDENSIVLLLNALYFSGSWQLPFFEEYTYKSDFYSLDCGTQYVDMMHKGNNYRYLEGNDYQLISLPFEKYITEMILVLPNEGLSAMDLAKSIRYTDFYGDINNMKTTNVMLSLPKFSISTSAEITKILNKAGLPSCTNLTKMGLSEEGQFLILQKTFTSINEMGAEASAVTAIDIDGTYTGESVGNIVIKDLTFDKPFLYFFINKKTGTILMAGVINNI